MKLLAITTACVLGASISHAGSVHNYAEIGVGASQLFSFNSKTNDTLSDYSVAPSFKLLAGSRLNKSRTLWFELGYSNNGEMDNGSATASSESLYAGLKLSTDPVEDTSFFVRGGSGKTYYKTVDALGSEKSQGIHYYGGLGMSFRLDTKRAVVIEVQHINDKDSDLSINGLFLSFNQFI